jgi:hypothetical protein
MFLKTNFNHNIEDNKHYLTQKTGFNLSFIQININTHKVNISPILKK